jgi:transcriptional regulator with XRE-family HTH domain
LPHSTLGRRLQRARGARTLRSVSESAGITPAYLQKLERDLVKKPSPNILYGLAADLRLPYSELMALAGYEVPEADAARVTEGNVLSFALSSEKLSDDEASALMEYLDWFRHRKATTD